MISNGPQFKWIALGLLFLNLFFCMMATTALPPLFSEITKEIPLSKAQMGVIMGIGTLASLIFAPLGGGLGDRFGGRWIVTGGTFLIALSGGLRSVVGNAAGLAACMFFLGGGQAILCAVMPKVLSTWFPSQHLARANGICFSSLGLGTAIAMGTAASFMSPQFGGWRNTMTVLAVVSLASAILWTVFYHDRTDAGFQSTAPGNMADNFKRLFAVREIWLIAGFYSLIMISLMSIITLLPVTLEEKGVVRAGEFVSILLAGSFLFNIIGGILSDRTGKRKAFLVVCALICALCIPFFISVQGAPLALALAIAGAAIGTTAPILVTLPIELKQVGTALAGTAAGLIMMLGNTGGFIGPVVTGALIDTTGSPWPGFIFLSIVFILAAVLILPLQEPERMKGD